MAEEKKETPETTTIAKKKIGSSWADNLLIGTVATGVGILLFKPAPLIVPIMASLCCGIGAIAVGRAFEEHKWIQLIANIIVMAFAVICGQNWNS